MDASNGHMTCQSLMIYSCKLTCNERGSIDDTLLNFMGVVTNQNLIGHVTMRRVFVFVLTNYMIALTIPLRKLQ